MGHITLGKYFSKKLSLFATFTAVFKHFLHWFDFFYGSITCTTVFDPSPQVSYFFLFLYQFVFFRIDLKPSNN